jgi:hypothetical protein
MCVEVCVQGRGVVYHYGRISRIGEVYVDLYLEYGMAVMTIVAYI